MTRLGSLGSGFNVDALTRRTDRVAALGYKEASPLVDSTRASPATQAVISQAHYLYADEIVTNLIFAVSTAAAGTSPAMLRVGVWDSGATPTCRAVSNDLSSSGIWTAVGFAVAPLSAAYTVPSSGLYYLAFLINGVFGTTNLQIVCANANAAAAASVASNRPGLCRLATGRTDMAVNDTGAYASGASAQQPWVAWN